MKQIVKDLAKREAIKQELITKFAAIAAKTNDPSAADLWKPMPEFPVYVVYMLDSGGPYISGFDSELKAAVFAGTLIYPYERDENGELKSPRTRSNVLDIAFCDSFPWEVMANVSGKKSTAKKPKTKKP